MTQRIIYFTAAAKPTSGELLEIAGLNDAAAAKYEVLVRNKLNSNDYGAGPEECDFVAGDPPSAYSEVNVFDVDEEPITLGEDETVAVENSAGSNTVDGTTIITDGVMKVVLDATDQIVSDTDTIVVKNSAGTVAKNATATVASGVISGAALGSTEAIVSHGATNIPVKNSAETKTGGTATVTVAAGLASKILLPATDQIVGNGDTVVVKNSAASVSKNGVAAVASGDITGVALASSVALVTDADVFAGVTGSGTTATITVTNGVISAIALS
jgi:hypothetical protein